jgi:peptide methionine sulfoxide reductase msrA/msrB
MNKRHLLSFLVLSASELPPALGHTQSPPPVKTETATFAGGCFWCMEPPFDKLPGVISTTSGYTGGRVPDPGYQRVSAGGTGHAEVVQVVFDPTKVSYDQLLRVFWRNIDPLAKDRQFCDSGDQYRSAIFAHGPEQRKRAEASKKELEQSDRFKQPIVTQIADAVTFYAAEDYHQDFYLKNPTKYKFYRWNCGRDQRLKELWGERSRRRDVMISRRVLITTTGLAGLVALTGRPQMAMTAEKTFEVTRSDEEWRKMLSKAQYDVLRKHGTERAGTSPLNGEKRKGTYACAGCDLPLYSSETKYESGTGWPSFWQPLPNAIGTSSDRSWFTTRTEVHCRRCGGHLGHVFDDGPKPTGLRYCMNGVAMKFTPAEDAAKSS